MSAVFLVGDGHTDLYGLFSTRKKAEVWIQRQRDCGYPYELVIDGHELDAAADFPEYPDRKGKP